MTNLEMITNHQAVQDILPGKNSVWSKNKKWLFLIGGFCVGVGLSVLCFTVIFRKTGFLDSNAHKRESHDLHEKYLQRNSEIRARILDIEDDTSSSTVCRTNGCIQSAFSMLRSINFSVDPCEDFYEFTCGRWIHENPLPDSVSKWSHFSVLDHKTNKITREFLSSPKSEDDPKALNQARDFYASCINIEELDRVGLNPLLDILEEYGGWPLLYDEGTWDASKFDWMISLADLKRVFSTSAIYDIIVNQNTFRNASLNTVHFNQPTLFMSRPFLIEPEKYPKHIHAYKQFIMNVALELKRAQVAQQTNVTDAVEIARNINMTYIESQAEDIIQFEAAVANVTRDASVQYYLKDASATVSLEFLQGVFDNYTSENATITISLQKMLDRLFLSSGVNISSTQLVSMSDVQFIGNIFEVLLVTPEEVLANYLHFRMAAWLASGTVSAMRAHVLEYHRILYGTKGKTEREYTCASSAEDKFGLAIGFKYMQNNLLDMEMKAEVENLYEEIRSSFKVLLGTIEWMDEDTHNYTMKRADLVKSCVGFPDWIGNKTAVDSYFENLDLDKTPDYFHKLLKVKQWQGDKKLKSLHELFDPECRWSFPSQIGAYYDVRRKAVSLPGGVLQFPFYLKNRPKSLNYGALGTIIGHEITHGFTVTGWTQDIHGNFTNISQCLIDQYSSLEVPDVSSDAMLNGQLTLDENFPDNGGLLESYSAFLEYLNQNGPEQKLPGLEQYNSEQLFFISFANNWCSSTRKEALLEQILTDHHSPARFRVLGALRNFEEFSTAFNCPIGSKMNPENATRCSIF